MYGIYPNENTPYGGPGLNGDAWYAALSSMENHDGKANGGESKPKDRRDYETRELAGLSHSDVYPRE